MRTLYTILGAHSSDSITDLKKAYHQAARKFHPDKNHDSSASSSSIDSPSPDPCCSTPFIELNKAWQILSDEESRRQYDSWLREQIYREETSILYETVAVDEILESWTVSEGEKLDSESTAETIENRKCYFLDCRCGGCYVFDQRDIDSYGHESLYVLCSNCSLVVKVCRK